jgi:hypothetical protein
MKLARTYSDHPVDELCQLRDELRVIWVALGGTAEDIENNLCEVREHVNGIANHLGEVIRVMSGEPQRMTGGQRNG